MSCTSLSWPLDFHIQKPFLCIYAVVEVTLKEDLREGFVFYVLPH